MRRKTKRGRGTEAEAEKKPGFKDLLFSWGKKFLEKAPAAYDAYKSYKDEPVEKQEEKKQVRKRKILTPAMVFKLYEMWGVKKTNEILQSLKYE